jgi:TetR/AcrR family transcriptional repressor of nem operon
MGETRQEIMELADRLIRQKGYNAFSYRDIAIELQVRNAAVHHHFPAKSDLGVAVIGEEIRRITTDKQQSQSLKGIEQLKKLIETFFCYKEEGLICLPGSLTPDYDTLPLPMQEKVKEMCLANIEWAASSLEKARLERDILFQGSAADRALLVISTLLSSLLLSRVLGEGIFERMMNRLLQDMGAAWRIADLRHRIAPAHRMDQQHNSTR